MKSSLLLETIFTISCMLIEKQASSQQSSVFFSNGHNDGTIGVISDKSGPMEKITRNRRNARKRREFLWRTRIIPFEISYDLRRNSALIFEAMKEIERKSCLQFKKLRSNDQNWIKFELGDGCSSSVGKAYWRHGPQSIVLDYPCLEKRTILHELMHSLGFWHEHSRPDRDKSIEIFWENIDPVNEINFEKYDNHEVDTLGIQYDLKSILHYGNYAFSKNRNQTLKAIVDPKITLGNSEGLSDLDVVRVNAFYDCKNSANGRRKSFMSAWSSWSVCDLNCRKQRQRFCVSANLEKCRRTNKHGVETETKGCYSECFAPIDGHWSRWTAWSSCSTTCGNGSRSRTRRCSDPQPQNGGKACVGIAKDLEICKLGRCDTGPYDCDFESASCTWKNERSDLYFFWQVRQGGTPSRFTGPLADHTTGRGRYLYTEASFPAKKGMIARFISPIFVQLGRQPRCLQLWYNLNGDKIGGLKFIKRGVGSGEEKEVWRISGNKGDKWNEVRITLNSENPFQVVLEAKHPGSYLSDIAVDDIKLTDGSCQVDVCDKVLPLGLSQGLIGDRNLLATTMKDVAHSPVYARLKNDSAWCVGTKSYSQPHYLRIDLGREVNILAIATQGLLDSWVKKYQLYYRKNTGIWHKIVVNGKGLVFSGNNDANSIAKNKFPKPVTARFIGLNPLKWRESICLRVELYGCSVQDNINAIVS